MLRRVYHAKVEDLPREIRFNGTYQRTGVVSDNAIWSFVWLNKFTWPEGMHHQHTVDQMMFMISGRMHMWVGDEEYDLEPGDFLYIPSNIPHRGQPVGEETAFFIEGFSPIRMDYLYIAEHQIDDGVPPRRPDGSRVDDGGSTYPFDNPRS